MKIFVNWEIFIGLCLSLILQTSYRFAEGVGLGEFGLALFVGYEGVLFAALKLRRVEFKRYSMPWVMFAYLLLALLPVTLIHLLNENPGTSMRDFFAYLISFLLMLGLAAHQRNIKIIVCSFLIFTFIFLVFQFFYGGEQAWYSLRFTGGAKNPNQLALYMVCAILLTVAFVERLIIKIGLLGGAIFFGIASISDAFMAYLAVVLVTLILTILIPKKYFVLLFAPIVGLIIVAAFVFIFEASTWFVQAWEEADEGGARIALYMNGLNSWSSSPLTFLLGNGAGSFSGIDGSFQGSEAHNTPIDLLSVGGVVFLVCVYYFLIKYAINAYLLDQKLIFACAVGLIVYSFFHFVARQPIFWFTIFTLSEVIWMKKKQGVL